MKLSIITINYNNLVGLKKTVDSVLSQTWRDFEWIIVDGGSTDGSKEYIETLAQSLSEGTAIDGIQWYVERFSLLGFTAEYLKENTFESVPDQSSNRTSPIVHRQSYIANHQSLIANRSQHFLWCSEPDKGIYNAMNKGIVMAQGEYLQFLNSGDSLVYNNVVENFYHLNSEEDIIVGNIVLDGNVHNIRTAVDECDLDYEFMINQTILHPSSFIKRTLFLQYGLYDENYRIISDWKFFLLALIQYSCTYKKWNCVIVDFDTQGISESKKMNDTLLLERRMVLDTFLPYVNRTFQKKEIIARSKIQTSIFFLIKITNKIKMRIRYYYSRLCLLLLLLNKTKNQLKENERIIVSMTSWTKRVENVPAVVYSILSNTMLPHRIVLNLSIEEFPNKERDLPNSVIELLQKSVLEIIWNEGNTKTFKKIIPTMKKFPNDIILSIDDDFIYPKDFIETFMYMHKHYPDNPLSGNTSVYAGVKAHCGCASLVKRSYFGKYLDELLDEQVIAYGTDDIFYTVCATLNGSNYYYVGKEYFYNMQLNNPICGFSENGGDENIEKMFKYLTEKVRKKYHLSIYKLNEPVYCL